MNVAVIDTDSGFVQVLTKRMQGMGWQFRTLGRNHDSLNERARTQHQFDCVA